jgi:hypothetical protein
VDGVWACASLLHLPRNAMPAALSAVRQVLRPGGALYLSVVDGDGEEWLAGEHGRRRFVYWRQAELQALLAGVGFTVGQAHTEPALSGGPRRWVTIYATRSYRWTASS